MSVTKLIMFSLMNAYRLIILTSLLIGLVVSTCHNCNARNVTCVHGVCLPRCTNVTSSGTCLQCRDSRYYGKHCENLCPYNCLNSRCQLYNSRVMCTEGCGAGKRGDNCVENCPPSCTQCSKYNSVSCKELCLGNCEGGCDRYRFECKRCQSGYRGRYCDSCVSGYRGQRCNETCPTNCVNGCDKYTGVCYRCKTGYRGKYCNEICPWSGQFYKSDCNKYTGKTYLCTYLLFFLKHCENKCSPYCMFCNGNTNECLQCHFGYWGRYCNLTCPSNCMCNKDTGKCEACNSDYSEKYCNLICPSNCEWCLRDTGECIQCRNGYRGKYCDLICLSNCAICNRTTGECLQCKAGYGEESCNVTCPSNCERCNSTGECWMCKAGYRGKYCNVICPNCVKCDPVRDMCMFCKSGYKGPYCDVTCSNNCAKCDWATDACHLCASGYKGRYCNVTCPSNCRNGCDRYTGECYECNSGLRGRHCTETCPPNCDGGCDRYTGECNTCMSGYAGRHCDSTCNVNCQDCDIDTGQCRQCVDGKKGKYCNETCLSICENRCHIHTGECDTCISGYTGRHCNSTCTVNCQDCDVETRLCRACIDGKKGYACVESCPLGCIKCKRYGYECIGPCSGPSVYGTDCSQRCSSACDGCDKHTGVCNACSSGFNRTFCDEICSLCEDVNCSAVQCVTRSEDTTTPLENQQGEAYLTLKIVCGTLGTLLLLVVSACVGVLWRRHFLHILRQQRHGSSDQYQHYSEITSYSDRSQYLATKYWEIKDEDLDSDPILVNDNPTRDVLFHQCTPPPPQYMDVVLQDHVYEPVGIETVAGACAAAVEDVPRSSISSGEIQTEGNKNRQPIERKEMGDASVTSEGSCLSSESNSIILLEPSVDLSNVYVKYITPKQHVLLHQRPQCPPPQSLKEESSSRTGKLPVPSCTNQNPLSQLNHGACEASVHFDADVLQNHVYEPVGDEAVAGACAAAVDNVLPPSSCINHNRRSQLNHGACEDSFHFDADVVLQNHVYEPVGVAAAVDDVPRSSISSGEIQTEGNKNKQPIQRNEMGVASVTSEDSCLSSESNSIILLEPSSDLSNVYVKYITPKQHDHKE